MPGYIPAPVAQGRIKFPGTTAVPITAAGTEITPGVGLVGSVKDNGTRLQLDASKLAPPETFSLFTPGLLANGQILGVWSNTRANKTAPLLLLEANIKTPGTGTPTDCFGIKLVDSAATAIQLPFPSAAGHFVLNGNDGGALAQSFRPTLGSVTGSDFGHIGIFEAFTPTQALTVTGVTACVGWKGFGAAAISGLLTCRILDAGTFAEIAKATVQTSSTYGDANAWGFTSAITLAQGHAYLLCFDAFEVARPGSDFGVVRWVMNGTAQSAPLTALGDGTAQSAGYVEDSDNGGFNGPSGKTWTTILSATGADHGLLHTNNQALFGASGAALLGGGGLGSLVGDVTASVFITGAPATGPTDVNLRALFSNGA